ncbi:MAG: histidine--tRNA ligase [Proteobacteria bacterium]|nr:histidine--tRNA ligase [Pseudomonadota bacterium]
MEKLRTLRGFRDVFGEEIQKFNLIENVSRKYFNLFGFKEIEIPVLEKTELFVRSIGDTTDIVEKEMFTFVDLGGDSVTLRPEATAGMVRAYLQEGLYAKERISKVFTIGSMFRHERPQKGRYREFHQVDVETFGTDDPLIDAELLWMITLILKELNVAGYIVEINSVGCKECRESFRNELVSYFETKKDHLCEDCLRRLERNPLRIFDCKNSQCIDVTQSSPFLFDSLCEGCKTHFETFLKHLNDFNVAININKRLVRGLDYYSKTVFEITSGDLGAQKAFIAGGRYNNLVEEMGGPSTPAIGFAIGVERLALITSIDALSGKPSHFFAYVGEEAKNYLVPILRSFISEGLSFNYAYEGKSLKSQMRFADSLGADYVLILGDDEIAKGIIVMRDMRRKNQHELPLEVLGLAKAVLKLTC